MGLQTTETRDANIDRLSFKFGAWNKVRWTFRPIFHFGLPRGAADPQIPCLILAPQTPWVGGPAGLGGMGCGGGVRHSKNKYCLFDGETSTGIRYLDRWCSDSAHE